MAKRNEIYVSIIDFTETHSIVRVEKKGMQFQTTWATEYDKKGNIISPTIEQVKEAFIENPRNFND